MFRNQGRCGDTEDEARAAARALVSMVGGDELRGFARLHIETQRCCVQLETQGVVGRDGAGEARAAARAGHLREKRCGGVFMSMVGREVWRRGVSACTKIRRGCCVQTETEGVGGRD